jgi:hypothetical protein
LTVSVGDLRADMFWNTKNSEKADDETAAKVVQIVEDLGNPWVLYRFLFVGIAGNVIIWLAVLIFPNSIYRVFGNIISDKIGMIILGVPLSFGLFTAYCLLRLKFPDIEDNKNLDSKMMASFNYQTDSTKRWFVWLFSILAGILNVILLMLAVVFRQ